MLIDEKRHGVASHRGVAEAEGRLSQNRQHFPLLNHAVPLVMLKLKSRPCRDDDQRADAVFRHSHESALGLGPLTNGAHDAAVRRWRLGMMRGSLMIFRGHVVFRDGDAGVRLGGFGQEFDEDLSGEWGDFHA